MSDNNNQSVVGTSDMPAPQTINYNVEYRVTEIFIKDLCTVLKNSPYVEVKKLLDFIESYNRIFPVAVLNEFIRTLTNFPYKVILPLMKVIENQDKFKFYFETIKS